MAGDPHSVSDILDRLDDLAGRERKVKLGDVVKAMGNRSHGPFLLVPALVIATAGSVGT